VRVYPGIDAGVPGVSIEVKPEAGAVRLTMIQAMMTGIGEGARSIRFLTELADIYGIPLVGNVKRLGKFGLSTANLRS
jgi:hypothetical protein